MRRGAASESETNCVKFKANALCIVFSPQAKSDLQREHRSRCCCCSGYALRLARALAAFRLALSGFAYRAACTRRCCRRFGAAYSFLMGRCCCCCCCTFAFPLLRFLFSCICICALDFSTHISSTHTQTQLHTAPIVEGLSPFRSAMHSLDDDDDDDAATSFHFTAARSLHPTPAEFSVQFSCTFFCIRYAHTQSHTHSVYALQEMLCAVVVLLKRNKFLLCILFLQCRLGLGLELSEYIDASSTLHCATRRRLAAPRLLLSSSLRHIQFCNCY